MVRKWKFYILLLLSVFALFISLLIDNSNIYKLSKDDIQKYIDDEIHTVDVNLSSVTSFNHFQKYKFNYLKFRDSNIIEWNQNDLIINDPNLFFKSIKKFNTPIFFKNRDIVYRGKLMFFNDYYYWVYTAIAKNNVLLEKYNHNVTKVIGVSFIDHENINFEFYDVIYVNKFKAGLNLFLFTISFVLLIYTLSVVLSLYFNRFIVTASLFITSLIYYVIFFQFSYTKLIKFPFADFKVVYGGYEVMFLNLFYFVLCSFFFSTFLLKIKILYPRIKTNVNTFVISVALFFIVSLYFLNLILKDILVQNYTIELNPNSLLLFTNNSYLVYSFLVLMFFTYLIFLYFFNTRILNKFSKPHKIMIGFSLLLFLFGFFINVNFVSILCLVSITYLSYYYRFIGYSKLTYLVFISQFFIYSLMFSLLLVDIEKDKQNYFFQSYVNKVACFDNTVLENKIPEMFDLLIEHKNQVSALKKYSNSFFQETLAKNIENIFFKNDELNSHVDVLLIDTSSQSSFHKEYVKHLDSLISISDKIGELDFFKINYPLKKYSYIGKINLKDDSLSFYLLFKYAYFPDNKYLNVDTQFSNALKFLKNYNIAHVNNHKLIYQYGNFLFPSNSYFHKNNLKIKFTEDEYDYYQFSVSDDYQILFSNNRKSLIHYTTIFSFIYIILVFLALVIFIFLKPTYFLNVYTLKSKIYSALIVIVLLSLTTYAFSSISFSNKLILDKFKRDYIEISEDIFNLIKTSKAVNLSETERQEYLSFLLYKYEKIFLKNINIYNSKGILIPSPIVLNDSLSISTSYANFEVLNKLRKNSNSLDLQVEVKDDKVKRTVYLPFYNWSSNELIGIVSIDFSQTYDRYDRNVFLFIQPLLNIFVLLLFIILIISFFIGGLITKPLAILKNKLDSLSLKGNEQIKLKIKGEIGELIDSYNLKVIDLEKEIKKNISTERELAWRDVAKQVAHEIKNPLTPMKLNIQYLRKNFDAEDPQWIEKSKVLSKNLLDQIDLLDQIATDFSNFAKMPNSNPELINVDKEITSLIFLYNNNPEIEFKYENSTDLKEFHVFFDKNQFNRSINNIFKNAIQAKKTTEKCVLIDVLVSRLNKSHLQIQIKDNGIGISEADLKKIFEPKFTTKSNGMGIGLTMVKSIIESFEGEISTKSKTGIGTTFFIQLPYVIN